jgi:hypothetical protein
LAQILSKRAQEPPMRRKLSDAPPSRISAGHYDVQGLGFQQRQHPWQKRLVMLKIRIHHRDVRSRGRHHPLDARRGKSAPPDPL